MNKIQLADARLYGIVDMGYVAPDRLEWTTEALCEGGVQLLQLRAKGWDEHVIEDLARRIMPIVEAAGVPIIINDYPELVPSVGADGAHVGQDDYTVEDARWRAGRSLAGEFAPPIIGKSTHSIAQAGAAQAEGADYIGFGPLFPTPTKPGRPAIGLEEIRLVHQMVQIPIFCIGGVSLETLMQVIEAGAQRVVMVSALLKATDIVEACKTARAALG